MCVKSGFFVKILQTILIIFKFEDQSIVFSSLNYKFAYKRDYDKVLLNSLSFLNRIQ